MNKAKLKFFYFHKFSFNRRVALERRCRARRSVFCRSKNSQRGQAVIEYILLLSMIAGLSFGFLRAFNGIIEQGILGFNAVLEKELATGSFREKQQFQVWGD